MKAKKAKKGFIGVSLVVLILGFLLPNFASPPPAFSAPGAEGKIDVYVTVDMQYGTQPKRVIVAFTPQANLGRAGLLSCTQMAVTRIEGNNFAVGGGEGGIILNWPTSDPEQRIDMKVFLSPTNPAWSFGISPRAWAALLQAVDEASKNLRVQVKDGRACDKSITVPLGGGGGVLVLRDFYVMKCPSSVSWSLDPLLDDLEKMGNGELYMTGEGPSPNGIVYKVSPSPASGLPTAFTGPKKAQLRVERRGGERSLVLSEGMIELSPQGGSCLFTGVSLDPILKHLGKQNLPITPEEARFYIVAEVNSVPVPVCNDMQMKLEANAEKMPHGINDIVDTMGRSLLGGSTPLSSCGGRIVIKGTNLGAPSPSDAQDFRIRIRWNGGEATYDAAQPGISWKNDSIILDYWLLSRVAASQSPVNIEIEGIARPPRGVPYQFAVAAPAPLCDAATNDVPPNAFQGNWKARIGGYGKWGSGTGYVLWAEGGGPGTNYFGAFPDPDYQYELIFTPRPDSQGMIRSFSYRGVGRDVGEGGWPILSANMGGVEGIRVYHSSSHIWFFFGKGGLEKDHGPWTVTLRCYKSGNPLWEVVCSDKISGDPASEVREEESVDYSSGGPQPGAWRWDPNFPTLPPTWADLQAYILLREGPPSNSFSIGGKEVFSLKDWYSNTIAQIWEALLEGKINLKVEGDGEAKVHPITANQLRGSPPETVVFFLEALIRLRSHYYGAPNSEGRNRNPNNHIAMIYDSWKSLVDMQGQEGEQPPSWYEALNPAVRGFYDGSDIGSTKQQALNDNFLLEGHSFGGADWESGEPSGKPGMICFSNPVKGKTEYIKYPDFLNAFTRDPRSIGSRMWGLLKGAVNVVLSPLAWLGELLGNIAKSLLWWIVRPLMDAIFSPQVGTGDPGQAMANIYNPHPVKIVFNSSNNALALFLGRIIPGILALVIFLMGVALIFGSIASENYAMQYDVRTVLPRILVGMVLVCFFYLPCGWLWGLNEWLCRTAYHGFGNAGAELIFSSTMRASGRLLGVTFGTVGLIFVIIFGIIFIVLGVIYAFRGVMIILLTVTAPFAFFLWIIPSTERYFKQWLSLYVGTLFVKFIHILVLFIGGLLLTFSGVANNQAFFDSATLEKLVALTIALIGIYAVMLKAPGMLVNAAAGSGRFLSGILSGAVGGYASGFLSAPLRGAMGALRGTGGARGATFPGPEDIPPLGGGGGGAPRPLGGGGLGGNPGGAPRGKGGAGGPRAPLPLGGRSVGAPPIFPMGLGLRSSGAPKGEGIAGLARSVAQFDKGMRRLATAGAFGLFGGLGTGLRNHLFPGAGGEEAPEGVGEDGGVQSLKSTLLGAPMGALGFVRSLGAMSKEDYRAFKQGLKSEVARRIGGTGRMAGTAFNAFSGTARHGSTPGTGNTFPSGLAGMFGNFPPGGAGGGIGGIGGGLPPVAP
jgi:hypothetical protein